MKTLSIEFTGAARALTGEKQIRLDLADEASYRDIVQVLAGRYPQFVGVLISDDRRSFLSASFFQRLEGEPILPDGMGALAQDSERLVILYFIVGG